MAVSANKIVPIAGSKRSAEDDSIDSILSRRSQELILGLCGASGSGIRTLKDKLIARLKSCHYHVEHIRISDLMIGTQDAERAQSLKALDGSGHFIQLQDLGDALRDKYGSMIAAQMAIRNIRYLRDKLLEQGWIEGTSGKTTNKVAYIIDQLKHPAEIELLREVYRNNFYLIGLIRSLKERRNNLKKDSLNDNEINEVINRDRRSAYKYGQQVEDTLHSSDYFIHNTNDLWLDQSVIRFVDLVHGANNLTPTRDETGMFNANSASLRSACLSRQVGAAIMDENHNLLATGCNDVPVAGGGLYSCESGSADKRCYANGGCHNDQHKKLVKREIEKVLEDFNVGNEKKLAEEIMKTTKLKSLIEYSRAIHAEIDAITSVARSSRGDTLGKILYCTTYPCHNCARHIVAAGIKRVVYIEPYAKSLAEDLHGDSITGSDAQDKSNKVIFDIFEGTAPRRYSKFFGYSRDRKDANGKVITYDVDSSHHVDSQQMDSYTDFELKVVQNVTTKIGEEITS